MTLADPLGSVATKVVIPAAGQALQIGVAGSQDEYGNVLGPWTGVVRVWLAPGRRGDYGVFSDPAIGCEATDGFFRLRSDGCCE